MRAARWRPVVVAVGVWVAAGAAIAEERFYEVRFRPVVDAATYVLETRVANVPWSEQQIGNIPGLNGTRRGVAIVDVPARSAPEFTLRAVSADGLRSQPSEILSVQALPARCDITGDGTVSALDGARVLQFSSGNRATCP